MREVIPRDATSCSGNAQRNYWLHICFPSSTTTSARRLPKLNNVSYSKPISRLRVMLPAARGRERAMNYRNMLHGFRDRCGTTQQDHACPSERVEMGAPNDLRNVCGCVRNIKMQTIQTRAYRSRTFFFYVLRGARSCVAIFVPTKICKMYM